MSKTILLADDSVTIRKVVELTFMDESFDLVSVGSGSEALERFDSGVDLVIADVHMPGADGYQVCEEVKKRSPETPVLLLVGTFETYDEKKASDAGADGHLKKPFDSQDLLGRVHDLLVRLEGGGADDNPVFAVPAEPAEQEAQEPVTAAEAFEDESADEAEPESDSADSTAEAAGEEAESPADEFWKVAAATGVSDNRAEDINMSDESVDRIARRVVELLSEDAIREVAWEVIPDLVEVVIKERLNELESQVE